MRSEVAESADWDAIASAVEPALDRLSTPDRQAILLRFYRQMEYPEMAAAMGISEAAAKKRVERAVQRLRKVLGKRGVAMGAAALAAGLMAHAAEPAPAAVLGKLSAMGAAITHGAAVSGKIAVIAKGVEHMFFWKKAAWLGSLAAAAGIVAAIVGVAPAEGSSPATRPALAARAARGAATAAAEDTPVGTLRALNAAMADLDADRIASLMDTGGDKDWEVMREGMKGVAESAAQLRAALVARFGEKEVAAILPQALSMGLLPEKDLAAATVKIDGEHATVTVASLPGIRCP